MRRRIIRFAEEHCVSVWKGIQKQGFARQGSPNPQTVFEHIQDVRVRVREEGTVERFSPDELADGDCEGLVHEMDEAATGKDKLRLGLPHRRDQRGPFVENWELEARWIPTKLGGGVSPRWREDWETDRKAAFRFIRRRTNWLFAYIVIRLYYDPFHVGMDRVSILARDCHYAETVSRGIAEKAPARHFALEAISAIATPRIRAATVYEYGEAVKRGEQKPI